MKQKRYLYIATVFVTTFIAWTIAVMTFDVKCIGPHESQVGFSTINGVVHNLTGVHLKFYDITDWLGIIPIVFVIAFAILGLAQWIKRKKLLNVDFDIIVLGAFYIVVIAVYLFFEHFVVNYRPVLINGYLEASYPSSTTMLVMCVMPISVMQLKKRIKNNALRRFAVFAIYIFIVFMVIGRLASGVHWVTDIIGGALFSIGIVMLYRYVCGLKVN